MRERARAYDGTYTRTYQRAYVRRRSLLCRAFRETLMNARVVSRENTHGRSQSRNQTAINGALMHRRA